MLDCVSVPLCQSDVVFCLSLIKVSEFEYLDLNLCAGVHSDCHLTFTSQLACLDIGRGFRFRAVHCQKSDLDKKSTLNVWPLMEFLACTIMDCSIA